MKIHRMGHVALHVTDLKASLDFYSSLPGLKVRWAQDKDWANLSVGNDDLSLVKKEGARHPPHIGFRVNSESELRELHKYLESKQVSVDPICLHRDKSVSFYFKDPDGNILEALWDPSL